MKSHRGGRISKYASAAALVSVLALGACESAGDGSLAEPNIPDQVPDPAVLAAAWRMEVNVLDGSVDIYRPRETGSVANLDILESQIDIQPAGRFDATRVNADENLVEFDVNVINLLATVDIIAPVRIPDVTGATATDPSSTETPQGAALIPYACTVEATTGGVVNDPRTDVLITLPNRGPCNPNDDPVLAGATETADPTLTGAFDFYPALIGDGTNGQQSAGSAPLEFVFDEAATVPDGDRIQGGTASQAVELGFITDRDVAQFTVFFIVGGDLESSVTTYNPDPLTVTVEDTDDGLLEGATITVTPGVDDGTGNTIPGSGTTDAAGQALFANPQVTNQTVTVDFSTVAMPTVDCSGAAPVTDNVLVPAAGATSLTISGDFCSTVTLAGTIQGVIESSLDGSGIADVVVTAEPNVGSPTSGAPSSGTGAYSIGGVDATGPDGDLTVSLASLPANCQDVANAGPFPYTGLTDGGTITVDLVMACDPLPEGYEFSTTWSDQNPSVGDVVTLSFSLDMSTFNPSVLDVGAFDFVFTYDETVLTATSCTGGSFLNVSNTTVLGQVTHTGFTTSPSTTNPQDFGSCTFDVIGAGTSTQVFTWNSLSAGSGSLLDVNDILHIVNQSVTGN